MEMSEWAPIEDNPRRYLNWIIMTEPCLITGHLYSDPHHITTRGAGGAERDNVVPLKRVYHVELHTIGQKTFEKKYNLNLRAEATRITTKYDERGYL